MVFFSLLSLASAHKPSFGNTFTSSESAYQVVDPNISIVVYQELTCENPELWMSFDAEQNFPLYVQLGVPVIDWLDGYRPTVAVLAEGLPEAPELPFDVPEGMGAVVFDSHQQPQEFYEPFTQTESWVWVEEWIEVTGEGYIVGWHPDNHSGKIWLATGEVEDFSDVSISDFAYWTEAVNSFHETGRFERPEESEVIDCLAPEEPSTEAKGCAVQGVGGIGLVFLSGLFGLRRRRN